MQTISQCYVIFYIKCVKHVILSLDVWCRVGKFTEDESGIGLLKMVNTEVTFIYCLIMTIESVQ